MFICTVPLVDAVPKYSDKPVIIPARKMCSGGEVWAVNTPVAVYTPPVTGFPLVPAVPAVPVSPLETINFQLPAYGGLLKEDTNEERWSVTQM
jgi:hypothetical protein